MTVGTRSGGEALRKQECRIPPMQALDGKSSKLQQFLSAKTEVMANKSDRHGVGEADWIESLQECPVYYPSKEDFAEDPLSYIQKIAEVASKYGMCKIVSPVLASMPAGMVLSKEQSGFRFTTRLQPMRISNWEKDDKVAFPIKGRHYTLTEYEKVANRVFSRKFSTAAALPPRFIESEFWKELVGGKTRTVEYATDVDGSAFSTSKRDPLGQSKWNLKGISKLPQSILRLLEEAIPGVTEPMLYIGMLFSMFAWHIEDHYLYSINYQHCGAPKTWYGVPGDAAVHFEKVVREHVYSGELLNDTGKGAELELLLEKTTMFAPKLLTDHGVPVFKAVQYPGEFIITFPRAYHAGFSHGFNCGEAVNFAMADWFPFGAEACLRYESLNRQPLLPHDELLCKEATKIDRMGQSAVKVSLGKQQACAMMAFVTLMQSHCQVKSTLERQGAKTTTASLGDVFCGFCNHKCYVAYTRCKCFPEPICFNHGEFFGTCSCKNHRMIFIREDFANLQLAAQKYERKEEKRKQAQKLCFDNDTAEQGDGASRGVSESIESSLLTNAASSREACDKREDREEACSGDILFKVETSGALTISDCTQVQEEEEEETSDTEVLRIKRRRVASPQSKRFQVDEQEIAQVKSSVQSLDCRILPSKSESETLDKQEHTLSDKQEHTKDALMIKGVRTSVYQAVDELNIKGSAAEVTNQGRSDQGITLKVEEVTVGQESARVLLLKCHDKMENFKEKRTSLCVISNVTHPQLTAITEVSLSPRELHSDSDKKRSAESKQTGDLGAPSSLIGSTMLHDKTAIQEVQDVKGNGVSVNAGDAPKMKGASDTSCTYVLCDPKATRVEGGNIQEEECLSSEAVSMEPEPSVPLTDSVAESPIAAANVILERNDSSSAAAVETCKPVTSHIDKTAIQEVQDVKGNGVSVNAGDAPEVKGASDALCTYVLCDPESTRVEGGDFHEEECLSSEAVSMEPEPSVPLAESVAESPIAAANVTLVRNDSSSAAAVETCKPVMSHIDAADMGNGEWQGTALADEGRLICVDEMSNICDTFSQALGSGNILHGALQPLVDVEIVREGNKAKSYDNSDQLEAITSSLPEPNRGLIIHLNRKGEQPQRKAATLFCDQNKSENEYDQVDIFEGDPGGGAWDLDEEMSFRSVIPNVGETISPLEYLTLMSGDDLPQHHFERDDTQECFAESSVMKAERFSGGEYSRMGHHSGKCDDSQVDSEFPLGELGYDPMKPLSNLEPKSQPMPAKEEDHAWSSESINKLPSREDAPPAACGKQQETELCCELTNEILEELPARVHTSGGNYAQVYDIGLDVHAPRFSCSSHHQREAFGINVDVVDQPLYKTQIYGGVKTDPYIDKSAHWGCGRQGRNDSLTHHHRTGQTAFRNNSGKNKHITRRSSSSLHQEYHPYHKDTYRSRMYRPVFWDKELGPYGYWKKRPNRNYNGGWRDAKSNNSFGGESRRVEEVIDRQVAGCSSSTLEGSGYVEGYDPVKWEISPSVNFGQLSYPYHNVPSSWAGRER